MLLTTAAAQSVKLAIRLPRGARLASTLVSGELKDGERMVTIADTLKGRTLLLKRRVHLPAGRVQPEEYPDFVQFARRADDAQSSSIRLRLAE